MLWDSVTLIIQLQRPWLGEVREDSLIGRIPHPPPSYPHTMVGVRCHPYYRRGRMGPYHPPISQLPSRLAAPCLAWNLWSVIRALPLLHFDPLWSAQPRNFPFPTCPKASFSHLPIHTTHFIPSLGIKHSQQLSSMYYKTSIGIHFNIFSLADILVMFYIESGGSLRETRQRLVGMISMICACKSVSGKYRSG